MNCPTIYSEESCQTPCELRDCTDEHLTSFCPPPCQTCSVGCCTPCGSTSSCFSTSSCCVSPCEPNAICSKPTNACHNRYEILKHIVRCPPKPSCMSASSQLSRKSYKPVVKCEVAGLPCYETIYMRAFNTPEACCAGTPTICCDVSSCCTLGC